MAVSINGSGSISGFGCILQVVQTASTAAFTTSSTSFADWTGLSATITPKSATSKILAMVHVSSNTTAAGVPHTIALVRGSTEIAYEATHSIGNGYNFPQSLTFLDSPATTSATTYKVQVKTQSPYAFTANSGLTRTITLLEVAA